MTISNDNIPAVPKWHEFMTPILRVLSDDEIHSRRQLIAETVNTTGMTQEQMNVTLATGDVQVVNRIGWALSRVVQTGPVERPARAAYRITELGHQTLKNYPSGLRPADLKDFPEWVAHEEAKAARQSEDSTTLDHVASSDSSEADATPEDRISAAVRELDSRTSAELLQRLQEGSPEFFEDAVVKLLLAMDYGGAEQRGVKVGGSADGGIDGFVDQDPLGLERVYIQAKRYSTGNGIGRETLQAFIGALHGRGATKGVFITTSHFSSHARDYAENIPTRIVLIDGERLTSLMIKYRVGVQVERTYKVVTVDEDFFE